MKTFKKQHKRLPREGAVERLIRRYCGYDKLVQYRRWLHANESLIPLKIQQVCLARPDHNKRQNIQYFPDLRTFLTWDEPNRSLPVQKFMDMFRGMISQEEIERTVHQMTNYRLEFVKTEDEWIKIYDDENIDSCMTGQDIVRCYAHPENDLAIAVLYPPGCDYIIARTIVNLKEKWWVRLFGEELLADKLVEQGYRRLQKKPDAFKMYAFAPDGPEDTLKFPYFDIFGHQGGRLPYRIIPNTYNSNTDLIEVIINPPIGGVMIEPRITPPMPIQA